MAALPPTLTQEQSVEIGVLARRGTEVREMAKPVVYHATRCVAF
jgi:hypothetical protein